MWAGVRPEFVSVKIRLVPGGHDCRTSLYALPPSAVPPVQPSDERPKHDQEQADRSTHV